jgi:NTP pyrophosphatase (non-canonical NTP hydrolase)
MNKTPNLFALVSKSVDNFDKSTQDLILIEEMSELTKELLKRRRGAKNDDCIKEELSHVLTSLYVVKAVIGISDEDVEREAKKKLEKYGWLTSGKE